jgi:hypothetical protein
MTMTNNSPNAAPSTPSASPKAAWSRWYEKDQDLLKWVSSLKRMPQWAMEAYCQSTVDYTKGTYEEAPPTTPTLERGSSKHVGLIKSMRRKRWYDQNPYTYKAFNALFLMEDTKRRKLAQALLATGPLMDAYLDALVTQQQDPNRKQFSHLLNQWLNHGEDEALNALMNEPLPCTATLEEQPTAVETQA